MGKGRKRKQGKREKNGRLSRVGEPRYDKGTERAQAMQALYGPDGADAIGRAFRAGLLGSGSEAKAMLDMARQVSNAYWWAYSTGSYTCAIADKVSGSTPSISPEKARRREEWLSGVLDSVNRLGRPQRRFFDALVIDVNPDCGPAWLDRLCFAKRSRSALIEPADAQSLEYALEALSLIADVDMPRIARLKAA